MSARWPVPLAEPERMNAAQARSVRQFEFAVASALFASRRIA